MKCPIKGCQGILSRSKEVNFYSCDANGGKHVFRLKYGKDALVAVLICVAPKDLPSLEFPINVNDLPV